MVNVLQVITSTGIGGAETISVNIGKNIDKSFFSVDYLVFKDFDTSLSIQIKNIGNLYEIGFFPKENLLAFIKKMMTFLKEKRYNVIHAHCGYLNWIIIKIAKKVKIKTIVCHSHNSGQKGIIPYVGRKLTAFYCKKNVVCLSCSEKAGSFLFGKTQYRYFHNGICTSEYDVDNDEFNSKFRKKYNIGDNKIIVHIGRFESMKNHEFILEIARLLKNYKEYFFVFAGSGPLYEKIIQKARNLELTNLIFLGSISYIPSLLLCSDVFILPSLWEGLPVSAIEGQCAGLPVLLSNNITTEVVCEGSYIKYLPLNEAVWMKEIIEASKYKQKNNITGVTKSGFSMQEEVKKLQSIYLEETNEV